MSMSHGARTARPTAEPAVIVDDDPAVLAAHRRILEQAGIRPVRAFADSSEARDFLVEHGASLAIVDAAMPVLRGLDLCDQIREHRPEIPIVVVTGVGTIDSAVEFMHHGCVDYLTKPVDADRLVTTARRAIERRTLLSAYRGAAGALTGEGDDPSLSFPGMVMESDRTVRLLRYAASLAKSREPILLRGETGSGKDVFARAIHAAGDESAPFVAVNAAGLDDNLLSDTLFGHRKGSFTGATDDRPGLVAQAGNGTLFLDEIGDLEPQSQVKLLRLLENREYFQLGSDVTRRSEARILLATHHDLADLVRTGRFRRDLYYRISTFELVIPALRDRQDDIMPLFGRFLAAAATDFGLVEARIDPAAAPMLLFYSYPGNVRELRSIAFRVVGRLKELDRTIANEELLRTVPPFDTVAPPRRLPAQWPESLPTLREVSESLIAEALARSEGNVSAAARTLGMTPQALHQRLGRQALREDQMPDEGADVAG